MTESLQSLGGQGKISRAFHADRDAGQVAAWVQRLKDIVDSFRVSRDWSTSKTGLCLRATIAGKCSGDGERRGRDTESSRGASEHVSVIVFVLGLNCVRSKYKRTCEEGLTGWKASRA